MVADLPEHQIQPAFTIGHIRSPRAAVMLENCAEITFAFAAVTNILTIIGFDARAHGGLIGFT
jgi:hypothetical protein